MSVPPPPSIRKQAFVGILGVTPLRFWFWMRQACAHVGIPDPKMIPAADRAAALHCFPASGPPLPYAEPGDPGQERLAVPPSTCASPTESLLRTKSGEIQAAEGPGPEARCRAPSPEWAALNWRQPLTSARPWEGLPLLEGKTASKPPRTGL